MKYSIGRFKYSPTSNMINLLHMQLHNHEPLAYNCTPTLTANIDVNENNSTKLKLSFVFSNLKVRYLYTYTYSSTKLVDEFESWL